MPEPASSSKEFGISGSAQQWALALLFGAVFLSMFYEIIPPIRYLQYAVLPVLILLYLGSLNNVRHPVIFVKTYTLPFLILLLGYAVFFPRINFDGIKDMLFISCYLVFFALFDDRKVNVRVLNVALLGVFAVVTLWRDSTQSFSLVESTGFAEAPLSFVFGFFAVFALLKKRYFWFLINIAALLLSLKRIVVLGVLAVLVVMMLPQRMRRAVTHPVVACIVNIVALGLLLLLGSGAIDSFFIDRYGFSITPLVMGRGNFYAESTAHILSNPLAISLFGAGPGAASETLGGLTTNLHSDVLKIFYDLGGIWFIAFIYTLYAVPDVRLRVLALYLNVLFLTDNTLIIVEVMVFYLILAAQLSPRNPSAVTPNELRETDVGLACRSDEKALPQG